MRVLLLLLLLTGGLRAQVTIPDTLAGVSPEFFLQLGNEAWENGEAAAAVLAYERGLRLRPGHTALQNNLRFVREEAEIPALGLPPGVLPRVWRGAGAVVGATAGYVIALILWALAVAGLVFWWSRRERLSEARRFALLPMAVVLLLLAGLFYALADSRQDFLTREDQAILMWEADLRVAPGPDATLEERLPSGVKFRVTDTFEGYVRVRLEDGREGWVGGGSVERI